MHRKIIYRFATIIYLFISLAACKTNNAIEIIKMQCEYLDNPLGIDTENPRFTWAFKGDNGNFQQITFHIGVATSSELLKKGKADVWDSKEIHSINPHSVYSGKPLLSHTQYYWQVTVYGNDGQKIVSPIASFEMAKVAATDWKAQWITDALEKETESAPLFRKAFTVKKKIKKARIYVSGGGYYEMFINGRRVGNHYLDPGYTHFDKRMLYVTHDATKLLTKGDNALAAVLGNGFYNCQSRAVWDFEKARWRNRPRLLCELRIIYEDGTTDIIGTDATWKTNIGPYIYNNIYSGDKYDSRLEEKGWNTANFDDSKWTNSQITEQPAKLLVAQTMPAIQVTEEIIPITVKVFGNKVYVFDMGKNISGVCRLKVKGTAGTTYTLRHGELLKENGRLEQGNIDVYYHPEKPGEIFQTDVFILSGSGEEEIFIPQFCYHGFRYVEVECSEPVTLTTDNLTGLFLRTGIRQAGEFKCSNNLLNKIWAATNLSYTGNIHSIPTDCPQREKNGWTADAHIAIDLALLNFDGITFYEKWMNDFIDNQRSNGNISGIIPSDTWGYGEWPGPVWDAALFIIPNALYNYYGETHSIEKLYPSMLLYLEYLKNKEVDGGYLNFGLGDWVFYRAQTPNDYTSTLYYYQDYKMMARFAKLLGKDATAFQKKAEELKELINRKYFNQETGVYANGTQTAQAIALYMDIVPEGKQQQVADKLHQVVAENNYFLDFGLLGSKSVPAMLTKYGYIEDAYKMITKTEAPSWGYWVETKGYTTLTETWLLSPEFHDASLNHVFMGDISAWMYNALSGINYSEKKPGFQHIIIHPHFVQGLDWAEGSYNSIRGMIRSAWKRTGNNMITLSVTIPTGCTATIYADKKYTVGAGKHEYTIHSNKSYIN